jgi:hypothetical protein
VLLSRGERTTQRHGEWTRQQEEKGLSGVEAAAASGGDTTRTLETGLLERPRSGRQPGRPNEEPHFTGLRASGALRVGSFIDEWEKGLQRVLRVHVWDSCFSSFCGLPVRGREAKLEELVLLTGLAPAVQLLQLTSCTGLDVDCGTLSSRIPVYSPREGCNGPFVLFVVL